MDLRRFEAYCDRKTREAAAARIPGFASETERASDAHRPIGNEWTRQKFDGGFYIARAVPSINLVFVESREGNTEADNPPDLGGGETDKHLIYEGLTRVEVDAVMAGATTAREDDLVFSVWHPELVRLRQERGRPRHPIQIIVTDRAEVPLDTALLYTTPTLRTILITSTKGAASLRGRTGARPWIDVIDAGQPLSIATGVRELLARGIRTISAVGGRTTAGALLEAGLVSDLYLTTSPISAGQPGTPLFDRPLNLEVIVEKRGLGSEAGVRFQHFALR